MECNAHIINSETYYYKIKTTLQYVANCFPNHIYYVENTFVCLHL